MLADRLESRSPPATMDVPRTAHDAHRGATKARATAAHVGILLIDPRPLMAEAIESFLAGSTLEKHNLACDVTRRATAGDVPGDVRADLLVLHVPANAEIGTAIEGCRDALPPALRDIPIVLYAETWRSEDIWAALRAGVRGYLPTSLECMAVLDALRLLAEGLAIFPPLDEPPVDRASAMPKSAGGTPPGMALTLREREVLLALQSGKTNKAIASDLGVSLSTVKVHIRAVFRKTGAQNRTEAALASRGVLGNPGRD